MKKLLLLFFFSLMLSLVLAQASNPISQNEDLVCKDAADCMNGDGCQGNVCVHTELAISESDNQFLGFSNIESKDTLVYWTLSNVSDVPIVIVDMKPTGCTSLASCELLFNNENASLTAFPFLPLKFSDRFVPVQDTPNSYESLDWKYFDVDSESEFTGLFNSLVLDSKKMPHASYFDVSQKLLKYAFFDGSKWNTQTVTNATPEEFGTYTSIDIYDDKIGIAFRDSQSNSLKYAEKSGTSSWNIQTIATPSSKDFTLGERASLTFDRGGIPHIAYVNRKCNASCKSFLVVAALSGTTWNKSQIDTFDTSGGIDFPSIDFSENNTGYLAYSYGSVNSKILKVAKFTGQWIAEIVYKGSNIGFISLKANTNPHISFFENNNDSTSLNYTFLEDFTNWNTTIIETGKDTGYFTSIGLSKNNQPSILYFDRFNKRSRIATKLDSGWAIQTAADPAFVSDGMQSLAIGQNGFFHILFASRENPVTISSSTLRYGLNSQKVYIVTDLFPVTGSAPFTVSFEGFTDLPETQVEFIWAFSDGQITSTVTGKKVNFTFNKQGENFATLSVILKTSGVEYARAEVKVDVTGTSQEGLRAVAEIDPLEGRIPLEVNFDASKSTSTNSAITGYFWEIRRVSNEELIYEVESISGKYAFEEPGEYIIKLRVIDDKNQTDEVFVSIVARSSTEFKAKILTSPSPPADVVPLTVDFDASGSDIPAKMINVKYEWSFENAGGGLFTGESVSWTFADPGTYKIILNLSGDIEIVDPNNPSQVILQHLEDTNSVVVAALFANHFVIPPWQSRVIKEKVTLFNTGLPHTTQLGVDVKYTDSKFLSQKERSYAKAVFLKSSKTNSGRFGVSLLASNEGACVGYDGLKGVTGKDAVPKVEFTWDWSKIGIDRCDKKASDDFIFCDPSQFATELAFKLDRINSFHQQGNDSEAGKLMKFEAFLIEDTYSVDFQKDFAYYYTNIFLPVQFFASSATPWHKFFSDETRLNFEPRTLPNAGLYTVTIEVDYDFDEGQFFSGSNPAANITIKMEPKLLVGTSLPDSPFYHLPFNGLVGTLRLDDSGQTQREGYGTGFTIDGKTINLVSNVQEPFSLPTIRGSNTYTATSTDDLIKLNGSKRGKVLEINSTNKSIEFFPSYMVPIAMSLPGKLGIAQAYYNFYESEQLLTYPDSTRGFTTWTALGSSPHPSHLYCQNFDGTKLFDQSPDTPAIANSCANLEGRESAYGFSFAPVIEDKTLIAGALFFVPLDRELLIRSSCSEAGMFASKDFVSTGFNEPISLRASGHSMASLQDVVNLVDQEQICISNNANEALFYWNLDWAFNEAMNPAVQLLAENMQVNWENYKCELDFT